MGRGTFTLKADGKKYTHSLQNNNKDYSFELPKAEDAGATMKLTTDGKLTRSLHADLLRTGTGVHRTLPGKTGILR